LPVAVVGKLVELVGDAWAALVVSVLVSFSVLIALLCVIVDLFLVVVVVVVEIHECQFRYYDCCWL
jgi:hypothetical protein